MKFFPNRTDKDYIDYLVSALSPENLMATAVESPNVHEGMTKCIHIDFCGISGSTLLVVRKSPYVTAAFEKLFENLPLINQKGIYVKVRFLFSYLYSDFSFSLIAAELTSNRATIAEPEYIPKFHDGMDISYAEFYASNCFKNQSLALGQIESIISRFDLQNEKSVNSLTVRFATIPLNLCSLIINDECFSDPYLYSRKSKSQPGLANIYPTLYLNKQEKIFEFNCVADDFRYLWNQEQTLDYKDVMEKLKDGRLKIKAPDNIEFNHKSKRIQDLERRFGENLTTKEDILKYSSLLAQNLRRYTRRFYEKKENDSIFIACSWGIDPDIGGDLQPNKHARGLKKQLEKDFGRIINAEIVITGLGEDLFNKIESELENSTLGIIIITKDIESNGLYYTKPNVYFEYGFLQHQLRSKVVALVQEGTVSPSNTYNKGHYKFSDNILLEYLKIIIWISTNYKAIPPEMIAQAVHDHEKRIRVYCNDPTLKARGKNLLAEAKDFLAKYLSENNIS